ncbi:methyltransferase domain-containing protein [bacterium]|nr:methyltransferase domain-containing protein [bacterium]
MSEPEWYRTYFEEPYGEIYAEYLLPPEIAREEAQFACDALDLQPGMRILDAPCGYGRHMDALRPLFRDIVGLDLNPDCLKRARVYLPGMRIVHGDLRHLPFAPSTFDAALNLFNSFGYFDEETNRRVLLEYRRVLKSGGGLFLDLANPEPLVDLITEHPRTQQQVYDLLLTEDWDYDPDSGILHNKTHIELAGRAIERCYDLKLYHLEEIRALLDGIGLETEKVFGDFDGEDYDTEESTRMIVVAQKR